MKQQAESAKPQSPSIVWLQNTFVWLLFTVCSALALIAVRCTLPILQGRFGWGTIAQSIAQGELLGITIALTGESIGFLLISPRLSPKTVLGFQAKTLLTVFNLAVLGGSLIPLVVLTVSYIENDPLDAYIVMWISFTYFVAAIVAGVFCKGMEE